MAKYVTVGSISKSFGADGQLYIKLFDEFPDDFDMNNTPLFVQIDNLDVPLYAQSVERRGKSSAIVQFEDIDSELRAQKLIGLKLRMRNVAVEVTDADDELYMEDLIGFKAELGGGKTGVIEEFIDSDMNPLLRIDVDGTEVYIPAVDEFIKKIRTRKKIVEFSLPDGLLDLYFE